MNEFYGIISDSDYENIITALMLHGVTPEHLFNGIVNSLKSIKIVEETSISTQEKETRKAIRSLYRRK